MYRHTPAEQGDLHRCRATAKEKQSFDWLSPSFSYHPCVFGGVGSHWLGSCLGRPDCLGPCKRFHHSYTSTVLGSDDWQSASGHQRLPNNGARALINVIVMLDAYNIWKPLC